MTDIDVLHRPALLPDLLVAALQRNRDRPVLHIGDAMLTGAELSDRISRFAQALATLGIGTGSTTALLSSNRPEVLISMGATMITGCRNTPLGALGSVTDHAYVLEDAGIETLIYDPGAFEERAAELKSRVPSLRHLLALDPTEVGIDVLELADTFSPRPLRAAEVDPLDPGSIVYTDGTTGLPKGVMMTYRSGATLTQIQMAEWEWPDRPRFLLCTPLSHAGAAFFVPTLLRGGSLIVLPGFEPGAVLEAIEKYRITATMLVPTMIYLLLDHPDLTTRDLSGLRTVFYGAAAISPTRLAEGIEKLGPVFFHFYGQTECGMTISVLRTDEHTPDDTARLASCGRPVPWLDVRLLDDNLTEAPTGEPRGDLRPGTAGHGGLLEQARADHRRAARWLAAHRRYRPRGQGLVSDHCGPQEGHDHHRWVQRLPTGDRGRHRGASRGGLGRGDRRPGREMGRGGQGLCGAPGRRRDRHR